MEKVGNLVSLGHRVRNLKRLLTGLHSNCSTRVRVARARLRDSRLACPSRAGLLAREHHLESPLLESSPRYES